eukprot:CAMPEP_0197032700 /NCGR_PEP_ID=MMETSP1384-20130603/11310_1 /TAXON_ID=29189 /ORGANISM="Ammonia sp." /LENGTH=275 /DNA_ID=CAMNT_0042462397 /DNA_START=23 /DNA_END=847 /DNA_ORIENTATION=-
MERCMELEQGPGCYKQEKVINFVNSGARGWQHGKEHQFDFLVLSNGDLRYFDVTAWKASQKYADARKKATAKRPIPDPYYGHSSMLSKADREASYTAGSPVVFAGEFWVDKNGEISKINAGSGHYRICDISIRSKATLNQYMKCMDKEMEIGHMLAQIMGLTKASFTWHDLSQQVFDLYILPILKHDDKARRVDADVLDWNDDDYQAQSFGAAHVWPALRHPYYAEIADLQQAYLAPPPLYGADDSAHAFVLLFSLLAIALCACIVLITGCLCGW